jgi:hypothetical protein
MEPRIGQKQEENSPTESCGSCSLGRRRRLYSYRWGQGDASLGRTRAAVAVKVQQLSSPRLADNSDHWGGRRTDRTQRARVHAMTTCTHQVYVRGCYATPRSRAAAAADKVEFFATAVVVYTCNDAAVHGAHGVVDVPGVNFHLFFKNSNAAS